MILVQVAWCPPIVITSIHSSLDTQVSASCSSHPHSSLQCSRPTSLPSRLRTWRGPRTPIPFAGRSLKVSSRSHRSRHFVDRSFFVEHSHEPFLTSVRASLALNNPAGIQDPVFGLLGNAAAAAGQGTISVSYISVHCHSDAYGASQDTDCLQQATADQAFTNAKAAGDVDGMINALLYRAVERNTGKVGLASVACTAIPAVNPEIAAISQHQVCSHPCSALHLYAHPARVRIPPRLAQRPPTRRLSWSSQSKSRPSAETRRTR